jgi:hypothetical protein
MLIENKIKTVRQRAPTFFRKHNYFRWPVAPASRKLRAATGAREAGVSPALPPQR